MITRILTFLLLLFSLPLFSQSPHPILRYFNANLIADEVRLNWVISGGETCSGIVIQRSTDGQLFETIGKIDGICGSPDVDVPYVFLDSDPIENSLNFYRLELGTQGYSDSRFVEYIPLNQSGYTLRYDIHAKVATIYLENDLNDRIDFIMFAINGSKIMEGSTNSNQFSINLAPYAGQIFVARIVKKNTIIPIKIPAF